MKQNNIQAFPYLPVFGYDNSEDADFDFSYMKYLYPTSTRKIQRFVEEECDKLEYEGSFMFDEYPDRVAMSLLAANIHKAVLEDKDNPEQQLIATALTQSINRPPWRPPQPPPPRPPWGPPPPPPRPPWGPPPPPPGGPGPVKPPAPGNNQDWLRNLIEVMLCNEMCQRRRRYRSRKRWM